MARKMRLLYAQPAGRLDRFIIAAVDVAVYKYPVCKFNGGKKLVFFSNRAAIPATEHVVSRPLYC